MTDRRIGVYVCSCGGNISDYVDVAKVREVVEDEPGVAVAKTHMFTCSDASQQETIEDIRNESLDGLVVASCSPKLHLFTFRAMADRAGLNRYQYVQLRGKHLEHVVHSVLVVSPSSRTLQDAVTSQLLGFGSHFPGNELTGHRSRNRISEVIRIRSNRLRR